MMKTILKIALLSLLLLGTTVASSQIRQQRAKNWCWAACIQSLIEQSSGTYYSQTQIAADLDGWPRDRPAHIAEVVNLLRFYGFRSWSTGRIGSPTELYNTLNSGWKLIAFVRPGGGQVGHFIVVQGIDARGFIVMSDPWYGSTLSYTLKDLYQGYRWEDSIVVGR